MQSRVGIPRGFYKRRKKDLRYQTSRYMHFRKNAEFFASSRLETPSCISEGDDTFWNRIIKFTTLNKQEKLKW